MIHELREYKLKPGKLDEYLDHVHTKVARLRGDEFGRLVAFFVAVSGDVERVIHIWEYASLDARQEARLALARNAGWMNEFIANVWPIIEYQHVTFLEVLAQSTALPFGSGGQYLLRRCEAMTGRTPAASELLNGCAVPNGQVVCRYSSIAPDGNTALDLVRVDGQVSAPRYFEASAQLVATFKGEGIRSIQVDLLQPIPISPFQ